VAATGSSLVQFLGAELAPTPGRARATARLVVASVVATALVMGFRIPEGHWIIIAIMTVGLADAGASIQKGVQRLTGTFGGGALGILVVAVLADEPQVRVPLMGLIAMATLFLSRTTTAPYVFLLGGITAVLVIEGTRGSDVNTAIAIGIWRIALMVIGVTIGTGAQVFLWPTDPETVLLGELACAHGRRGGRRPPLPRGDPAACRPHGHDAGRARAPSGPAQERGGAPSVAAAAARRPAHARERDRASS
jgi:hypothetical protein